ncbi:MAG: hypothetical protein AAB037_00310 [Chloroflexota bacterium]
MDWVNLVGTGALVVVTLFYAWRTHNLVKETKEANTLHALAEIHKTIDNPQSFRMREYLLTDFSAHLAETTKDVLGDEYLTKEGMVDMDRMLKDLEENKSKQDAFIIIMRTLHLKAKNPLEQASFSARDAVEHILLDFDMVAIPVSYRQPYSEGIEAAWEAAKAYKSIFERSALHILPFVAIQQALRGTKDTEYKWHYLKLLEKLNIEKDSVTKLLEFQEKLRQEKLRQESQGKG